MRHRFFVFAIRILLIYIRRLNDINVHTVVKLVNCIYYCLNLMSTLKPAKSNGVCLISFISPLEEIPAVRLELGYHQLPPRVTAILVTPLINMVPLTCTVRLHISAAHRMSCQALTVAVTLLSHRCYVCHSFACNHLQYQSV